MAANPVEPDQARGEIDEGDAPLAGYLEGSRRPESHRLLPLPRHVVAATDLGQRAVSADSHAVFRRREIEAHHLVIIGLASGRVGMPNGHHARRLRARHIAAPVDEFHQVAGFAGPVAGRRSRSSSRQRHATMAEEQSWSAQPGDDQFLEANRRGRIPAGEFRHEGDPRLLDPLPEQPRLIGRQWQ